jgi:hypothetical protein
MVDPPMRAAERIPGSWGSSLTREGGPGAAIKHRGSVEEFETIVIGGQADRRRHYLEGRRVFVILDANEQIGGSWQPHLSSLRLFTPALRRRRLAVCPRLVVSTPRETVSPRLMTVELCGLDSVDR